MALAELEKKGVISTIITQNVDALHRELHSPYLSYLDMGMKDVYDKIFSVGGEIYAVVLIWMLIQQRQVFCRLCCERKAR